MENTVEKCLSESVVSEIGGKHCWLMSVRIYCVRNWCDTLLTNVHQNLLCHKLIVRNWWENTVDKCLSESVVSEIDGKHCWQMSVRICYVRNWWETLLTNVCQNLLCQKLEGNIVDKCLSESIVSEIDGKHCWQIFVCQNLLCQKLMGNTFDKCLSESIVSEIDGKTLLPNVCQNLLCEKLMGNTLDKCLSESIVSEIGGKHCWQMSVRIYFVRNWWETLDKCLSESIVSDVSKINGKHLTNVCQNLLC